MAGTQVAIAAGSNLTDRLAHLRAGVRGLEPYLEMDALSGVVESLPEGDEDQGTYLNLVLIGRTALPPEELLEQMLRIERSRGRIRQQGSGEPRTLDLDLILYGSRVIRTPALIVPHPRWHLRPFVAQPLLEVLPDGIDPVSGKPLSERVRTEVMAAPMTRLGPLFPSSDPLGAIPRRRGKAGAAAEDEPMEPRTPHPSRS